MKFFFKALSLVWEYGFKKMVIGLVLLSPFGRLMSAGEGNDLDIGLEMRHVLYFPLWVTISSSSLIASWNLFGVCVVLWVVL